MKTFITNKQEIPLETVRVEKEESNEGSKLNVVERVADQENLGLMVEKCYKVVLCQDFVFHGVCDQGDSCKFAHDVQELHENRLNEIPFYKAEVCQYFLRMNLCPFGQTCMFAHSDQELRRN